MKYDAHVRITNSALRLLSTRCPRPNVCTAPWLKASPEIWVVNARNSNPVDNWGFGIAAGASYFLQLSRIFEPTLAGYVANADVATLGSLDHPEGQKYHFMRGKGEDHQTAFLKGVGFIHFHTLQFVQRAQQVLSRVRDPFNKPSLGDVRAYKRELSLAIHSLQDSFSPAHTLRKFGDNAPLALGHGTPNGAAPIRDIFIYDEQDHSNHAIEDYNAGSLDSGPALAAARATADLIAMGIDSVFGSRGLVGWEEFRRRWLAEDLPRASIKKL